MYRGLYFVVLMLVLNISLSATSFKYPSEKELQTEIYGNPVKMEKLLIQYISYAEDNPFDYKAQWKVGELSFYLWEYYLIKGDMKKVSKFVKIGNKYAEKALKLEPSGKEASYWLVRNYTAIGLIKGPMQALYIVKKIKNVLERMYKNDPECKYRKGSCLRFLGRVYVFAPGFPVSFGNLERGKELLEFVYNKYPKEPYNAIFLSFAYANSGKIEEAINLLKYAKKIVDKSDLNEYENKRKLKIINNLIKVYSYYLDNNYPKVPKDQIKNNLINLDRKYN